MTGVQTCALPIYISYHKYPVAEDFDKIYKYIYNLLVEANIKKDKELLEQALNELRGMRDTWKEVMVKAKQG